MTLANWKIHEGDALSVLRTMPDESVHCCVTSPPYYGLRDYGTGTWEGGDAACDHGVRRWEGDKQTQGAQSGHASTVDRLSRTECACGARRVDRQIGAESTPAEYIAALVAVFAEVRRVLRSDGTCWVNLGDSYANDGKWGGKTGGKHAKGLHGESAVGRIRKATGLKPKDLIGIPWAVAFALRDDGWWLRSDIVWAKRNPMPESVEDRPTRAHEYIFLLTKSAHYAYDADAIAEAATGGASGNGFARSERVSQDGRGSPDKWAGSATRNARSVWSLASEPYAEAHFATFPEEIPRRCIKAGSGSRGACAECGAPHRRTVRSVSASADAERDWQGIPVNQANRGMPQMPKKLGSMGTPVRETTGWHPSCVHAGEPSPCTVLDPFSGAGTTLVVALAEGRSAIGIELNPEYAALARRRIEGDAPLFNRASGDGVTT